LNAPHGIYLDDLCADLADDPRPRRTRITLIPPEPFSPPLLQPLPPPPSVAELYATAARELSALANDLREGHEEHRVDAVLALSALAPLTYAARTKRDILERALGPDDLDIHAARFAEAAERMSRATIPPPSA
jgi:hypothetical protein